MSMRVLPDITPVMYPANFTSGSSQADERWHFLSHEQGLLASPAASNSTSCASSFVTCLHRIEASEDFLQHG